jgi:hypothetical protein
MTDIVDVQERVQRTQEGDRIAFYNLLGWV